MLKGKPGLPLQDIDNMLKASEALFPKDLRISSLDNPSNSSWNISGLGNVDKNNRSLLEGHLKNITGEGSLLKAYGALQHSKEAGGETPAESPEDTRAGMQEKLKDKYLYAEAKEAPLKIETGEKEQKALEELAKSAKYNQKEFVDKFADQIVKNAPKEIKESVSPENLQTSAKQIALDVSDRLINKTPVSPPGVFAAVAQSDEVLEKELKDAGVTFATISAASDADTRSLLYPVLGENVTSAIYGSSLAEYTLTPEPTSNTAFTVSIPSLCRDFDNFKESSLHQALNNPITDEIRSRVQAEILSRSKGFLMSRLESLPQGSFLSKFYSSGSFNSAMGFFSGEGTQYIATNFVGRLATTFAPEYAPLISAAGNLFGLDVGLTTAVAPLAAGTIESTAVTAGAITAGTEVAGAATAAIAGTAAGVEAGATAGAAAGAATGPLALILIPLLALLGTLFSKLISSLMVWLKKHKEDVAIAALVCGVPTLVFGMIFRAVPLMIIGGGLIAAGTVSRTAVSAFLIGAVLFVRAVALSLLVLITTPIIIAFLVIPIVVAVILFIINSGAYLVPPMAYQQPGPIVSPYIGVTKTPNPPGPFANLNLPLTVEYTITVTAKKGTLTNINFKYECRVTKENSSPPCPDPIPAIPAPPASISPSSPFTFTYKQTFPAPTFEDTGVTDTFIVTADTLGAAGTSFAASASIVIGNPPAECPSEWPVYPQGEPYLRVTQGPHTRGGWGTHSAVEAIDIFSPQDSINNFIGHSILATHTGKVYAGSGGNYGRFIDITSTCVTTDGASLEVTSRYAHLSGIPAGIITGRVATKGQTIGYGGNSGTADAHLHYEFRPVPGPIPMDPKYLPVPVPDGCMDWTNRPCNIQY